jgi:NTE family protein
MTTPHPKTINLALQGGGAHGAFTWGVLEQFLKDGRVKFHTISGTSAGAMNAAVMISGLIKGGVPEALRALELFWKKVSESGRFGLFAATSATQQYANLMNMFTAGAYAGFDMLSRYFSPYQFNPSGHNPLKDILNGVVDFEALRKSKDYVLHISATDVLNNRLKIFTGHELSVDALLASSCLPQLFQAVEIKGHYYWDGGYMGNPTLFPLANCKAASDILIVQIDPIQRTKLPTSSEDIADRLNEISFNAPLLVELRGLHLINELLLKGHLKEEECGLRHLRLHMVNDEKTMRELPLETKFNPDWHFLNTLRVAGQRAAEHWLSDHYADVGKKSTFDIDQITS